METLLSYILSTGVEVHLLCFDSSQLMIGSPNLGYVFISGNILTSWNELIDENPLSSSATQAGFVLEQSFLIGTLSSSSGIVNWVEHEDDMSTDFRFP